MKQRLISTTQLALTLFLVIILTSCSTQPAQVKIKDRPKYEIKMKENWSPSKITLYRSSSSFNSFQPGDAVVELEARKAVYNLIVHLELEADKAVYEQVNLLQGNDATMPVTLITFADPKSGRVYIGRPYPFFAETKSGIFGVDEMDMNNGDIRWKPSLVDMSASSGGTKKAISRFEKEVDLYAIVIWDPEPSFSKSNTYTDLDTALGPGFFSGASSGPSPPPQILSINLNGQTLELNLKSSLDDSVGNVWVDMETHKAIKALRDGKTPPLSWPTEPPPPPTQTTTKP